jgi:hypothetical protein
MMGEEAWPVLFEWYRFEMAMQITAELNEMRRDELWRQAQAAKGFMFAIENLVHKKQGVLDGRVTRHLAAKGSAPAKKGR